MSAKKTNARQTAEHLDVLVIGAGISGISMACHLQKKCPNKSYAILERREAIGGTWDLFKYPGIRSDSDMFSFGFHFRPWNEPKVLADGPSIKSYVEDTAREYNVRDKIRFGLKITRAEWSSESATWTVTAEHEASGETRRYSCNFLSLCTGYYKYDKGYMPDFPGLDKYKGKLVHPQQWPEDLDYAGKNVVVIGSGATAITLIPSMAPDTAHITMLQRSPSYVISLPAIDHISEKLQRFLPNSLVYKWARRRNIKLQRLQYKASLKYPNFMRKLILKGIKSKLPEDFDMRHFSPNYKPWDERLCVVPNSDLFKAIRRGDASIVTDHIETFTETGIKLKSGETLEADIIISATGLQMELMGGMQIVVDGQSRAPNEVKTYKAVLVEDAPNLATVFGYTNASWTLKADLASAYVCRLLNHMDTHGYAVATPHDEEGLTAESSVMDALNSGYVKRAADKLPRQGEALPWKVLNHYSRDKEMLLEEPIEDGILQFERVAQTKAA